MKSYYVFSILNVYNHEAFTFLKFFWGDTISFERGSATARAAWTHTILALIGGKTPKLEYFQGRLAYTQEMNHMIKSFWGRRYKNISMRVVFNPRKKKWRIRKIRIRRTPNDKNKKWNSVGEGKMFGD